MQCVSRSVRCHFVKVEAVILLQLYVEMIDTMAEIEIAWERYADEISNFLSSMLKNFLF